MKDISKLYDQLKPYERVIAALSAMSREDDRELDSLLRTCPQRTFRLTDPAYTDRIDTCRLVAVTCYADFIRLISKLTVLGAWREFLTTQTRVLILMGEMAFDAGFRAGPSEADCPAGDPENKDDAETETERYFEHITEDEHKQIALLANGISSRWRKLLDELIAPVAIELATRWEAFGRFSRSDVGIDPITLLKAWGISPDELLELLAAYPDARPDETDVADFAARLSRCWARQVNGSDPAPSTDSRPASDRIPPP